MTVIEAWLRQPNILVKGFLVYEDEHTEDIEIKSLSLRGAMRTVTKILEEQGFTPIGRWETMAKDYEQVPTEVMRRFRTSQ